MPDERKFSELTTAATLTNDDILALSQIQSGALTSVKSTLYAIAVHITKLAQYTSDLQTTDKTIIGAINELKRLIALVPGFNIVKVNSLPTEDIDTHTLYLVPSQDPEAQNSCDEYINTDGTTAGWELVGSTNIDLSDYYTKLEVDGLLATKTVTITNTQTAGGTKAKVADITQGSSTFSLYADDAEAVVEELYTDETATGNPVTFKSITGGKATACKVTMNPIQDLHGYDKPWVGGAGKNKLNAPDVTLAGSGYIYNGVCDIKAGTYTISFSGGSSATIVFYDSNGDALVSGSHNVPWTFTLTDDAKSARIYVSSAGTYTEIMVEQGSAKTSFAPYSNICPISGRTGVELEQMGKNLIVDSIASCSISSAGNLVSSTYTTYIIKTKKGARYIASANGETVASYWGEFSTAPAMGSQSISASRYSGNSLTATIDGYIAVAFPSGSTNPMIELGQTITTYEAPITPITHTHTFGSTVYGGVDDFVSGEGSETYGIADLGSVNWTRQDAGGRWYFFTYVSNLTNCKTYSSPRTQPLMCSQYKNFHNGEAYADLPEGAIYNAAINNTPIIAIIDTRYTDANDFKTAMSGVQLCYELATLTQITNTPEDISLLKGVNVLSTDGDSLELTAAKIQEATGGGGAGGVDYSTAEQNTGIKWIDGKDVYQKTFVNTDLQHDSNYQGAFLLGQMPSGYDKIIGYEGIAEGTTSAVRQFVGFNGINDIAGWNCGFHITDGAILIYPAQATPSQMSSLEGGWAAVTVKYTKA